MIDFTHLITEAKFDLGALFNDIKTKRGNISPGTGEVVKDTSFLDDIPASKASASKLAKTKAASLNKKNPNLSHIKQIK